jgi:hypothetical protein
VAAATSLVGEALEDPPRRPIVPGAWKPRQPRASGDSLVAMPARAICVSEDLGVRAEVERTLSDAGIAVEHRQHMPTDAQGVALVVIDRAVRCSATDALRARGAPVVVFGDDLEDDALIALMRDALVSHVIGHPGGDLGVTSEKLVTGDFFGLEKYMAPGTAVCARTIPGDHARVAAVAEVCAWAEARGARTPMVHRIASVVDELLMNALIEVTAPLCPPAERAPVARWAADNRRIAVSVTDACGTLRQREVIDHVLRARGRRGRPQNRGDADSGAGLGLYLVLANVTSLVVNLEPNCRTEVVCLFELARRDRRAIERGATSLHVFAPA